MALRDLPYRRNATVYLLGGLRPEVVARVGSALAELLRRPDLRELRRRPSSVPRYRTVDAAVAAAPAAVLRLSEDVDDTTLVAVLRAAPANGLPITLAVAGDRVAVRLAHVVFDGSACLPVLEALLQEALGEPAPIDPRRTARLPVLTALRSVRRASVGEFAERRAAAPTTAVARAAQHDTERPRWVAFTLTPDDLAALRRQRGARGQGRATPNSRVCSVLVAALAAVYRGDGDPRVRVPVDLRHHVPDRRVDGNFICGDPLGTLFGADWSPWAVSRRVALAAGGSGVVSLASSPVRALGSFLRPSRTREVLATVSMTSTATSLPARAWADDARPRFLCMSIDPDLAGAFVHAWTIDGSVHVTASSSSGEFDLDALETACRHEVAARSGLAEPTRGAR